MVVVLANEGPGMGSVACGIYHDGAPGLGLDQFGYSLCADFDAPIGGWPESGGSDRISWDPTANCQRTVIGSSGVHAVAWSFYLYAYSPDWFMLIGYDDSHVAYVYDCAGNESPFPNVWEVNGEAGVAFGYGGPGGRTPVGRASRPGP